MEGYYLFVGLSVFVMGLIVGRLSMAVQYALMKPSPEQLRVRKQEKKNKLNYNRLSKKTSKNPVKIGYSVNKTREKQSVSGRDEYSRINS